MRIMYDSITPEDIPVSAKMVGGYVSGKYKWSEAGWARFPNAVKVRIATQASVQDGHVLDVEQGDATPVEAPLWAQGRRAVGVVPTIYCSASSWSAVIQAFMRQGVAEPLYWIAHYDGIQELVAGTIAKQFTDEAASGGHFDLSVVANYWPGIDKDVDVGTVTEETQSYIDLVRRVGALSGDIGDVPMSVLLTDAAYRVEALIKNTATAGGPSSGETNFLAAKLDEILSAVKTLPTLDQIQTVMQTVMAGQITITGDVKISNKT